MNRALKQELEGRALRVFWLGMERAAHQCPWWARSIRLRHDYLRVYMRSQIKNYYCNLRGRDPRVKGERFQVDHIIPLHGELVSGLHVPWNLQVIYTVVNQAKSNMRVPEHEAKLPGCVGYDRAIPKWTPTLSTREKQRQIDTVMQGWSI